MKRTRTVYIISTALICLNQGVIPIFTIGTPESAEGMSHLGYPAYFGIMLSVFKILGALVIAVPKVPARLKEWAYAGFVFDFIAAFVSIYMVDGLNIFLIFPIITTAVLLTSYFTWHKLQANPSHSNTSPAI
jgi:DoxX-like family